MEEVIFGMLCGFFSFYFVGDVFGIQKQYIKKLAYIGVVVGGIKGYTGKGLLELFLNE